MEAKPFNSEAKGDIRDKSGKYLKGHDSPGPGRPKGKTMKEFAREFLMNQSDEEKKQWLRDIGKDTVWKMAEGNPHQGGSLEVREIPIPLADITKQNDGILHNDSNKENSETKQEDKSSSGGY